MNDIDKIIRQRHSVRSYLDKEIEEDKISVLNNLIDEINSSQSLNFQLILNDNETFDKFILHYGKIKNAKNYFALIGKKNKALDETVGYYGEKLVLKSQELGLNTCWIAGTYDKASVKAEIKDGEKLVCIISVGYGENQGNERKHKKFEDVSKTKEAPDWYKKGVEYALLAPTAINEQKFKFEYVDEKTVKAKAGLGPMTNIDLGIVKLHFELGAERKVNWI